MLHQMLRLPLLPLLLQMQQNQLLEGMQNKLLEGMLRKPMLPLLKLKKIDIIKNNNKETVLLLLEMHQMHLQILKFLETKLKYKSQSHSSQDKKLSYRNTAKLIRLKIN